MAKAKEYSLDEMKKSVYNLWEEIGDYYDL